MGGTAYAREIETEMSLVRRLPADTALVWALGYGRVFTGSQVDGREPSWTAITGVRLTF